MDLRRVAIALVPVLGGVGCQPAGGSREPTLDRTPPLSRVEARENRQRLLDENGDGFIEEAEAEAYYQRRFAELDDNNDGRLSRAELEVEYADTPEAEVAYEELTGIGADAYAERELRRFNLRADRTTGMMSTGDFDEMVRTPDPMLSTGGAAR